MLAMTAPQTPHAFYLELLAVAGVAVVVTLTLALTPVRVMRREAGAVRGRRVASFAGVVLVFLLGLSVASSWYVPGGSFLMVWPGIIAALGCQVAAARMEKPGPDEVETPAGDERPVRGPSMVSGIVALLVVVPAIVLWGPILVQLFTAMTLGMAWACSVGVVVATATVLAGLTPLAVTGGGTGGRSGARRIDPA
jgi:hypothetical protein